jgi:hypothetical protein
MLAPEAGKKPPQRNSYCSKLFLVRTKAAANAEASEERMMKPSQRANASARLSLGSSTGCCPDGTQLHKLKCGLQTGAGLQPISTSSMPN